MNIGYEFDFCGARLTALGSGALWWADHGLLCVSDLHLGKAERIARRVLGGSHPLTTGMEENLRDSRAALRAREASTGSA